jgi:hypothetical protein
MEVLPIDQDHIRIRRAKASCRFYACETCANDDDAHSRIVCAICGH